MNKQERFVSVAFAMVLSATMPALTFANQTSIARTTTQQSNECKGSVKDSKGEPITGAVTIQQ